MNTVTPAPVPAYIADSPPGSKKLGSYAVQMYVDNQDGNGPVLQTVYLQAVNIFRMDENGNRLDRDDNIDYEWKRQLLDEMRAIRMGMELLLETGQPSFNATGTSLIEEARAQRLEPAQCTDILEQEM